VADAARIVIVGGGLAGLSVAYHLGQRGETDVLVLERDTLCSGGTAKSSGIARAHYGVPSLAAMAWHGIRFFESAPAELGQDIGFRRTGYVVGVGAGDIGSLEANVATQQQLGIPVDLIAREAVHDLWPSADLDAFAAFAYEPHGGHGDAYSTGMAFATKARALGVGVCQHSPVAKLAESGGAVRGVVLDNGRRIDAEYVVLAAGPWSGGLADRVGVDLPIRALRAQLILVHPGADLGHPPVFSDLVSLQYFRAEGSGELLVGNSDHSRPEYADPDRYSNRAGEATLETMVTKLATRLPGLSAPAYVSSYAGCYDVTPDFNPIIGPSATPGLFVCAGFSGHGFKISPAVGRLVSDLLLDGVSSDPAIPADDFRLSRFAEGKPLTSPHPYTGAGQMR
jgi:sarcosine oxidase, subunit beta